MKNRSVSIKFRDKEVENPVARFSIGSLLVIAAPFIVIGVILGAVLAVVLLVVLFPIWLPIHFLLRACGRKGFYRRTKDKLEIKIDVEAFRKA